MFAFCSNMYDALCEMCGNSPGLFTWAFILSQQNARAHTHTHTYTSSKRVYWEHGSITTHKQFPNHNHKRKSAPEKNSESEILSRKIPIVNSVSAKFQSKICLHNFFYYAVPSLRLTNSLFLS